MEIALLLFRCNSGFNNLLQCHVLGALLILLECGEILTLWLLYVPQGFDIKRDRQCKYNVIAVG
jgi:hypothetical protein